MKLKNGMAVDMGREQPKAPIGVRLQRFIEVYPEAVLAESVPCRRRWWICSIERFAIKVAGDGKGK